MGTIEWLFVAALANYIWRTAWFKEIRKAYIDAYRAEKEKRNGRNR